MSVLAYRAQLYRSNHVKSCKNRWLCVYKNNLSSAITLNVHAVKEDGSTMCNMHTLLILCQLRPLNVCFMNRLMRSIFARRRVYILSAANAHRHITRPVSTKCVFCVPHVTLCSVSDGTSATGNGRSYRSDLVPPLQSAACSFGAPINNYSISE